MEPRHGVEVPLATGSAEGGDRPAVSGGLYRPAAWALGAAVLVALVTASALATLDGMPTEFIRLGEAVFLSLCLWLLLLAASRRLWIALLLALPGALLLPLEIWLRLQFGTPSTAQSVALLLETSWSEVANFLTTYGGGLVGWCVAWFSVYAVALCCAWRARSRWEHSSYAWCLMLLPAVLILMYFGSGAPPWLSQAESNDPFDGKDSEGWSHQWADVFPVNMVIAAQQYGLDKNKTREVQRTLASRSLHGVLIDPAAAPEVVVLVIGESASATRWSLLGYPRQTTPLLQSEDNLVAFTDTVGLSVATRTAVPGVLSRRPVLRPDGYVDAQAEPSLIKAFGEAGYQTHWYSNQSPFGKFDTSIAVYAREAQSVRFLNPSTYESRGSLDEVLLAPLQAAITAPGRHLVVLHTLGSHFDFALRHPPAFNRFQPSRTSTPAATSAKADKERTGNSYDNSVLYTDYFLHEVLERIKATRKSSLMAYFSDHGVDLPDGPCRFSEVTRMGDGAYRVPMFFWGSEVFRRSRAAQWNALEANRTRPHTTRAIFATLLDLADIDIIGGRPADSLVAAIRPEPQPRLVGAGNKLVDFDVARSRNSCRISAGADN